MIRECLWLIVTIGEWAMRKTTNSLGQKVVKDFKRAIRKHKVTTDSNHKFNIAPNLLDRDFTADQSNRKWTGPSHDIPSECTAGRWMSVMSGRVRGGFIWP